MNGENFLRIIREAYVPFLTRLGFEVGEPSVSGKHHRASFSRPDRAIRVSYEPGEEFLVVVVHASTDGEPSDIDDRTRTHRLADLNARYMPLVTDAERADNDRCFEGVEVDDDEGRRLLKAAKELRLVLSSISCGCGPLSP